MLSPSKASNCTYWKLTFTSSLPGQSVSGRSRKIGPSVSEVRTKVSRSRSYRYVKPAEAETLGRLRAAESAMFAASASNAEPPASPTVSELAPSCSRSERAWTVETAATASRPAQTERDAILTGTPPPDARRGRGSHHSRGRVRVRRRRPGGG